MYYKCPKCNGSGKKLENEGDLTYYAFTFGIGLLVDLLDPVRCPYAVVTGRRP